MTDHGPQYDSTADTLKHIKRVNDLLLQFCREMMCRATLHDQSKLLPPEKEAFDEYTPMLSGLTYGSDEYRATLRAMQPAIEHHQKNNSHHPEFYADGINGMTLMDLVEMFFDWKAASERHSDGCIFWSIDVNKDRFQMSDQLVAIFFNTANALWPKAGDE
jgi:hypothetical protein